MGAGFLVVVVIIMFATGAFIGMIAMTALAYRREDRRGSLHDQAPDAVCHGTRRLTGVGTIGPAGWVPLQRPAAEADEERARS